MAVTPNEFISPQNLQTAYAVTDTANTTYGDSPTNTQVLVTAGANGARVTRITSIPRATVTATMLQLFLSKDSGTTKRLINSKLMSAHTVAVTTAITQTDWGYSDDNPLLLEAGDQLYVGQAVSLSGGISHMAEWGDY